MRGEKSNPILFFVGVPGSPPHARGKVSGLTTATLGDRITPACAGKSEETDDSLRQR